MTTRQKGTKTTAKKKAKADDSKVGPGRQSQVNPDNEPEGPLRVVLPQSVLEYLDRKQRTGLSRAAFICNLVRREMNREEIFQGKTDLELFAAWLEDDIEKGNSSEDLTPICESLKRFVRRMKKLEAKVYSTN